MLLNIDCFKLIWQGKSALIFLKLAKVKDKNYIELAYFTT